VRPLWNVFCTLDKIRTKRIFDNAAEKPYYLDITALKALSDKYATRPARCEYEYDAKALEDRGTKRAKQLLQFQGGKEAHTFLELGCYDGMVSCCLSRQGKRATAIDITDEIFDERASRAGVKLLQMDAADLQFENESFDFAFSYNTFEHFASPEKVLQEIIRVVRREGYIYLDFGPLYYAPFGAHGLNWSMYVPYCQFLFPENSINEFQIQRGLNPINFKEMNKLSIEEYRKIWNNNSSLFKILIYNEIYDLYHLNVIREYPSCFKSKSHYFDNFIVDRIECLFQKLD
jgi:ubiquinone/menaquinone biosynthesis C-methylase UbiE